ncbi:uncharacterized protein BDR25DRAFT_351629 [Lindgomyces ingoldianus]|uniref:Uncharacterized protein n=1 Tax=Lindgomyces ingoldianus TaxID=673940 RepID=A0ACB6R6E8_9PLEO|nr:uncharacterized protein BDR25DRAFT_351629 [Lindgomyces ingoldianus]KAF2474087.1 hypothetical protein BDR25DRAFT_351629 [Lindgomyces ingoldianus]
MTWTKDNHRFKESYTQSPSLTIVQALLISAQRQKITTVLGVLSIYCVQKSGNFLAFLGSFFPPPKLYRRSES